MDQGIIQHFNTLYRNEIVYDIDEGRPCLMNLLQSMHIYEKAWRNEQPNTIVNCFKKLDSILIKSIMMYYTICLENNDGELLLTDNVIMGINISTSDPMNYENDEPQRTLNMNMDNQTMSSLQNVRRFFESV